MSRTQKRQNAPTHAELLERALSILIEKYGSIDDMPRRSRRLLYRNPGQIIEIETKAGQERFMNLAGTSYRE